MMNLFESAVDDMTQEELLDIQSGKSAVTSHYGKHQVYYYFHSLALAYWYAPPRNKYVLLFILYSTYLMIAYYDYFYDCRRGQFGPTFLKTYYEWAKPRNSKQNIIYSNLCPDKKRIIFIVDILVFILLVAITPMFLRWNPK